MAYVLGQLYGVYKTYVVDYSGKKKMCFFFVCVKNDVRLMDF